MCLAELLTFSTTLSNERWRRSTAQLGELKRRSDSRHRSKAMSCPALMSRCCSPTRMLQPRRSLFQAFDIELQSLTPSSESLEHPSSEQPQRRLKQ